MDLTPLRHPLPLSNTYMLTRCRFPKRHISELQVVKGQCLFDNSFGLISSLGFNW